LKLENIIMESVFKTNVKNSNVEIVQQLINDLIVFINDRLKDKSELFIAISGGSTPQLLYKTIADKYINDFPWKKLHFFWVDERCVSHDSSESNFGNAHRLLFNNKNIPQENLHPIFGEKHPANERVRYGVEISSYLPCQNGIPTFDLILLGMGADGHTASIFPGQEYLFGSDNSCAISQLPETSQERITLTGKVINNAREIVVLVTGKNKAEKVKIVFESKIQPCFPIQLIKPVNGHISWYLDKEAWGK
jgi:6-phosphogluconolactonase